MFINLLIGLFGAIGFIIGTVLLYFFFRSVFYTPPFDPHTKSIKGTILSIDPVITNSKNSESGYTYINPASAGISSLMILFVGKYLKEYHIVAEYKYKNKTYAAHSYILGRNIEIQNLLRKFTAKIGDHVEVKVSPKNPNNNVIPQNQFYA